MKVVQRIDRAAAIRALGPKIAPLVPEESRLDVYECPASELLRAERIDVAIKAEYASYRIREIPSSFARDLYLAHIRSFNWFVETDGSGKTGPLGFVSAFDGLIDSMCENASGRTPLVPVSRDGILLDGAHRLAISLCLRQPVRFIRTVVEKGPTYDAAFFESRGLGRPFLDAAFTAYIERNAHTRIVLLWPTAEAKDAEAMEIIGRHARVVGRKDVVLSNEGPVHVVMRSYSGEPWLGDANNDYAGARNKARWCFQGSGPLRAVAVETEGELLRCKEELRALYGQEKHSVHINDDHDESLELAHMLFNGNSLHFLNTAPAAAPPWFLRLFNHYDRWLDGMTSTGQAEYCLDGSAVLAAYGIRDVRDLDYLHVGGHHDRHPLREVSLHNDAARHYPCHLAEIVFNPEHHLYFQDRKMVALNLLREMKITRGEAKDYDDVALIDALLERGRPRLPLRLAVRRLLRPSYLKGRAKLLALKIRYYVALYRRSRRD